MKLHIREYSYLNITFMFLLSIFALFVVYYFPLSYAQVNITSSQTLSNTPGNSTDPEIALYNNNVYVVWSDDSTGNGDIYFKRSGDNGTTFDSTNNISENNTGTSSTPQLAANSENVYIIWTDTTSGHSEINYRQSVDGGTKFQGIRELSKTRSIDGESSSFPQIMTTGDNVFVAWQDSFEGGNEIFFRASADQGSKFTGIKNLSRNNTGDSISPRIAAIANNVFVGWSDTSAGKSEILLRSSIDSGNTFRGIKNVSWSAGNSYDPQIALSRNNLYALWEDDSQGELTFDLTFRGSSDGGQNFNDKQNLARYIGESSDYGQLTATGSMVYVVWSENPQYSYPAKYEIFIKASQDNGTNFGDGVNLSNSDGNSIDPHIAVSEDRRNVYVIWSENSGENSEISMVRLRN